jgi:hypothetical protein
MMFLFICSSKCVTLQSTNYGGELANSSKGLRQHTIANELNLTKLPGANDLTVDVRSRSIGGLADAGGDPDRQYSELASLEH